MDTKHYHNEMQNRPYLYRQGMKEANPKIVSFLPHLKAGIGLQYTVK